MSEPSKKRGKKLVLKAPKAVSRARFEAFSILMEVERGQVYADDLLRNPRVSALAVQDRHLCTALVLGTLRWQIRLDALIRTFLSKPNVRLDPAIRIALRLGTLQLQYLDRIPAHAAISESVELAKLAGHQFASRMVNAVLRMVSGQQKPEPLPANPTAMELSEATAHPLWLVERWVADYGLQTAEAICEQGQHQPVLTVRVGNPDVEAELAGEGIRLEPGAILTAARRLISGDLVASEAFKAGRVRIQEEGSQLIAELAGHGTGAQGTRILDACAAPGGKTLILAERNPQAKITACELSPPRLEALRRRVAEHANLSANIEFLQGDAAQLPPGPTYDLILADVPCSGTGTMGRNPEIRHRLTPEDLARHHERQCAILRGVLRIAAPGGRVVYSTCSLEPEENALVVATVRAENPEWRQISIMNSIQSLLDEGRLRPAVAELLQGALAPDGSLTLLPGSLGVEVHTDGFYIAIFERRA